jgi:hypothetical protein
VQQQPKRKKPNKMTHRKSILRSFFLGAVFGLSISGAAMMMSGLGHGWGSAAFTFSAILIAPIAVGLSTADAKNAYVSFICVLTLAAVLLIDARLIWDSSREGWNYVGNVIKRLPVIFTVWLSLILYGHIFIIRLVIRRCTLSAK